MQMVFSLIVILKEILLYYTTFKNLDLKIYTKQSGLTAAYLLCAAISPLFAHSLQGFMGKASSTLS